MDFLSTSDLFSWCFPMLELLLACFATSRKLGNWMNSLENGQWKDSRDWSTAITSSEIGYSSARKCSGNSWTDWLWHNQLSRDQFSMPSESCKSRIDQILWYYEPLPDQIISEAETFTYSASVKKRDVTTFDAYRYEHWAVPYYHDVLTQCSLSSPTRLLFYHYRRAH